MNGYIAITHKCTHRCRACPCGKINKRLFPDLTYEEICDAIDNGINNYDIKSVIISGGEPTLHPDFFKILEYISTKKITVSLFTTCEMFSEKEFLKMILSIASPTSLRITTALHSFNPSTHDYITRSKGSWLRSFEGMSAAIQVGIPTALKCIMTQKNYMELPNYVEKYVELFPPQVSLVFCYLDYCGINAEELAIMKVSFDELKPYLETTLEYVNKINDTGGKRYVKCFDTPLCAISSKYWNFIGLSEKYLGIFHSPSLSGNKYRNNVKNDSAPQFEVCRSCKLCERCPGTWSSVREIFGEEIFHPVY